MDDPIKEEPKKDEGEIKMDNTNKAINTNSVKDGRDYNKNLFNESNNDHSRIQSERVISNNQSNKKNISTPPTGNFIFIKSQRYEGNKRKEKLYTQNKNKSPEQHQQLIRKNSTQEKKRISPQQNVNSKNISHQKGITNIKLQNKKSFCFVSRNNNKSPVNANKYENIYCGPINKINNSFSSSFCFFFFSSLSLFFNSFIINFLSSFEFFGFKKSFSL